VRECDTALVVGRYDRNRRKVGVLDERTREPGGQEGLP